MDLDIREEALSGLDQHCTISIAFEVRSVLELTVASSGLAGFQLRQRDVSPPYVKDYDSIPGNRPSDWHLHFDLSNWGLLSAWKAGQRIGGAVLAFDTPALHMLEGRRDLAVVWDLRVTPAQRGSGVGTALFLAALGWAVSRNCTQLKVETQNINVAACTFYANRGCELGVINRFAYPDLPSEVQLLWYKQLSDTPRSG